METFKINHNLLPASNNKTLAVVHWQDGQKYKVVTKTSSNIVSAQKFIDNQQRDIIINSLLSYVKQRNFLINKNSVNTSLTVINAVSRIRQGLDVYKAAQLKSVVKVIICLEKDLLLLLPGVTSTYYAHWNSTINQILTLCKSIHNEQETQSH